jgi:hypothetical protein
MRLRLILLALAAVALVSCASQEADVEVSMLDNTFSPAVIEVPVNGTVLFRNDGRGTFTDVSADRLPLYAGDQLRTGTEGTATVAMADETTVELAEDSVIAVGDRNAGADPAASVAVLYGVARFSVADRGPGEGPFLVYTSSGIVGTRGTTYAVGVAATGEAPDLSRTLKSYRQPRSGPGGYRLR